MAFPAVAAGGTTGQSSGSTTATLTYPTGIKKGDKLVACLTFDGQPTTSGWPSGWTQKASVTDGTNAVRVQVYVKEADGTETGTFNLTVSASEAFIWDMLRITGADQPTTIEVATASGSSTNPNPPNLDPTGWGTEDTLWIIYAGGDGGTTAFTAGPTNYTANFVARAVTTAANGVTTGISYRTLNAGSEDAGTFTRANEQWVAANIAVRTRQANRGIVYWVELEIPLVDMTDAATVYVDIQASATEGHEIFDSGTAYVDIQPSGVDISETRRGRVFWMELELPAAATDTTDSATVTVLITPSAVEGSFDDAGTVRVTVTPSGTDTYAPNRRGRVYWMELELPAASTVFGDAATPVVTITPSGADVYTSPLDAATVPITITPGTSLELWEAADANTVYVDITPSGTDTQYIAPTPGVYGLLAYYVSTPAFANVETGTVRLTITPSSISTLDTVDSSTARVTITPSATESYTTEGIDASTVVVRLTPSTVEALASADAATVYVDLNPSAVEASSTLVDAGTTYITLTPSAVENFATAGGTDAATVYVHITPIAPQEIHYLFDTNLSAIVSRNWTAVLNNRRYGASLTGPKWTATVNTRRWSGQFSARRYSAATSKKWSATAAR